jgi:exonuclease SbcC
MLLNKLRMRNFKRFRDQEIIFQDGITGIVGNNGTGKSSIVGAILFALYGLSGTGLDGNYIVSSFVDPQEACEVRLDFSVGGNEYAVVRRFKRRPSSALHEANLYLNEKLLANSVQRVALEVQRIIGMGPGDFRNSIYAGQKELLTLLESRAGSRKDWFMQVLGIDYLKKDSLEELKRLIDARDGDYREVHGRLKELDAKTTRDRLAVLRNERAVIEEQLRRIEDSERAAEERRGAIRSERDRRASVRGRYRELAQEMELILREADRLTAECRDAEAEIAAREGLQGELQRLSSVAERYEPLKAALAEMAEKKSRVDHLAYEAATCREQGREYENRRGMIEAELTALQKDEEAMLDLTRKVQVWQEIQDRIREAKALLPAYEAARDELARLDERFVQIERRVSENRQEVDALEEKGRYLATLEEETGDYELLFAREETFTRAAEYARQEERCRREAEAGTDELAALELELAGLSRQLAEMGSVDEQIESVEGQREYLISRISACAARLQGITDEMQRVAAYQAELMEAGPDGCCPMCHQGLGEHYEDLVGDLATAADEMQQRLSALEQGHARAIADHQRLTGELQALQKKRTLLQRLKEQHSLYTSRNLQILEQTRRWQTEGDEHLAAIRALGIDCYDPSLHEDLKERIRAYAEKRTIMDTLRGALGRLPALQIERKRLIGEVEVYLAGKEDLEGRLAGLGFDPAALQRLEAEEQALEGSYRTYAEARARLSRKPVLDEETQNLAEKIESLTRRIDEIERASAALAFNPRTFENLAAEVESAEDAHRGATELRVRLDELPRMRQALETRHERLRNMDAALAEIQRTVDVLGYEEHAVEAAEEALAVCEEELQAIRQGKFETTARIGNLTAEIEGSTRTLSRIDDLLSQQEVLREEIEALKLTRTCIKDYTEYLLQVVRDRIEEEAGRVLAEITDGRYCTVMLDDDFNVLVHDMGEDYPADRFSGGEQDDIAIALRIALSRFLAEVNEMHDSTFLIFDEIFGSQDEERRNNLIRALRTQEAHFPQIFLISHITEVQDEFATTLLVELGAGQASRVQEFS